MKTPETTMKHFQFYSNNLPSKRATQQRYLVVFHLPKNSGNSGWDVNGTRLFGSFHWKFSGINGISKKAVPFSRWKLPNGKFVFHLQISRLHCFYHQFQTFRCLLGGQASLGSLEWNLWQMERAFPKRKFPIETFRNFFLMENVPGITEM